MEKTYNHIWYLDCPHFDLGDADQWGETGYLLHGKEVYHYMVDRKEQYHAVSRPRKVADFREYAKLKNIDVPVSFMKVIQDV